MKKKSIWGVLLSLVVTFTIVLSFSGIVSAAEVTDSGDFGSGLHWELDSDGKLTISKTGEGSGDMGYFPYRGDVPWCNYVEDITKVEIQSGVTTIGRYAFYYCENLTSISIPSTVTVIDDYAFYRCEKLPSIDIPTGVTYIGIESFYCCKALTSVSIPSAVTSIGKKAFYDCVELTTCTIASDCGLTTIPEYMFYDCQKLTSVSIPNGVTGIEQYAFFYCISLETVSIPSTVTSIGNVAFYYCESLTTAYLSDNITVIGDYAFYYCKNLTFPNFPHYVETIGEAAFQDCLCLTELTIPDTVTSIGNRAFTMCENLETLTFPNSANLKFDTIPAGCFSSCKKLSQVTIPSGIKSIEMSAFNYCIALSDVTLPASVTAIGGFAFEGCGSLEELTLPDSVTTIGGATFSQSGLKSFVIPAGITEIPDYCFSGCSALESFDIPNTVYTIENNAFEGCTSLKSIVIPDSVTEIPDAAFCDCSSLESVTIPDSITSIGRSAFASCTNLTNVVIPDSVSLIDELAFQGTAIQSITLPGSLDTVKGYAFQNNEYLQSVTFSEDIEYIDSFAFNGCDNIKTAVIPSTVWYIGENALGSGENMTDIYLYANPAYLYCFSSEGNYNENTKIHVPSQYLADYQSNYWYISDLFVGDADGTINIGSSTHLCGYTLSMDGNIGVNFYMTLGDDVLNNASTAYMQFTINGKTQKVKVSDAARDGVYYVFRCDTVAKEMTDTISAQMFISEGNADGDAYTYSVRDYAVYILNHQSDFDAETIAVVKAMLNYGASAQKFFGYKTDNLANSVLSDNDRKIPYADPASMVFTSSAKVVNSDIKLEKVSLSLKSEITMKLYFSGDTTGVNFYIGPTKLKSSKSGSYTVVTITGIYAQNIGNGVNVDAYAGDTYLGSARCAPMKYCYLALTSNDAAVTPELKEVVSALYYYNQALIQYAG